MAYIYIQLNFIGTDSSVISYTLIDMLFNLDTSQSMAAEKVYLQ